MRKEYNYLIAINEEKQLQIESLILYIYKYFNKYHGDKQLKTHNDIFNKLKKIFNYNELQILVDNNTKNIYTDYCDYLDLNYYVCFIGNVDIDSDYYNELHKYINKCDAVIINEIQITI